MPFYDDIFFYVFDRLVMGTQVNFICYGLAAILAVVTCSVAAPAGDASDKPSKDDLMLLANLLQDPATDMVADDQGPANSGGGHQSASPGQEAK